MHVPNFMFLFQFRGLLCEEQTQKIRKKEHKHHSFEGVRRWDGPEKSRPPHLAINFVAQFGGKVGEEKHFFNIKKEENSHISFLNSLGGLIFWYVIQLLIFYWLARIGEIFEFWSFSTPPSKKGYNWILTQVHPHQGRTDLSEFGKIVDGLFQVEAFLAELDRKV